ncbi:MAG: ATPase [Rhodobacteraceae bacterium]|nr:ATPase [Paracoccaceae bacterium]
MQYFLGIDGGGTGCRAAVCDATGRILGQGAAGPANVMSDPDGARANILAAADQAAQAAGARLEDLHAVLGLAGANTSNRQTALPFATTRVVSDAEIALNGAFAGQDGIAATVGTGSVFACQSGGTVEVIGGWGLILGDEASGAWMGRELLSQAVRAADGLVPASPLLTGVTTEMGGPEAIVRFAKEARPVDFGRFAPRIVAGADDPAATAILADADRWICRYIDHLQTGALPLCFLGGLGAVFALRLAARYPGLIRPAAGSALDGALRLARGAA